jgi:hypothetical protein
MEMPRSFANHLLDDDDSYKVYVQQSILRLETIFGKFRYKFGKGAVSSELIDKQNKLQAAQAKQ